MARRQLLRERFQRRAGELLLPHDASSVPSLIEKDQGQRRPPRLIARRGSERQPAETLDDRGAGSGCWSSPGDPPAGSRNRSTRSIASVLCSRLLDEGDYVAYELEDGGFMKWTSRCKTHDRPGHRVRAGLGAALLVETPLGPRAARFLRVRLRRPRADVRGTWRRCSSSTTSWRTSIGTGTTSACSSTARAGNGSARGAGVSTPANPSGATASSPNPSTATRPRGPADASLRPQRSTNNSADIAATCPGSTVRAQGLLGGGLRHPPRQPVHRQRARQNRQNQGSDRPAPYDADQARP